MTACSWKTKRGNPCPRSLADLNTTYAASSSTYGDHPGLPKVEHTIGKPLSAYAAVIPKWTASLIQGEPVHINGDGETSRDFCFIANAVQANLLAATAQNPDARNQVYNVAVGDRTTLNTLFTLLRDKLQAHGVPASTQPVYRDFRDGDVRHSLADISKAATLLGYAPTQRIGDGAGPGDALVPQPETMNSDGSVIASEARQSMPSCPNFKLFCH